MLQNITKIRKMTQKCNKFKIHLVPQKELKYYIYMGVATPKKML